MAISIKSKQVKKQLEIPTENWVYFHHTGQSYIIPVDPESIQDQMGASFASSSPLSRSAPIYSYQNSGPRTVQVAFTLHRDLCQEFNPGSSDMVEELINNLEGMVLPEYEAANKIVNPPVVSLKIRDEIFIKGIVTSVGKTFNLPLLNYGGKYKYALVNLNFSVQEVTPYNASILSQIGGGRRDTGKTTNISGSRNITSPSQSKNNSNNNSVNINKLRNSSGGMLV